MFILLPTAGGAAVGAELVEVVLDDVDEAVVVVVVVEGDVAGLRPEVVSGPLVPAVWNDNELTSSLKFRFPHSAFKSCIRRTFSRPVVCLFG